MAQSSITFCTSIKDQGFLLVFEQENKSEIIVPIAHICHVKQHTNNNTEVTLSDGSVWIFSYCNDDLYGILKNIMINYYDNTKK